MTTIRKFRCDDLFHIASINLDPRTITHDMFHYQQLICRWSDYCHVAVGPGNRIIGYLVGVTEDRLPEGELAQVITVSVDREYRRQKVGTKLMAAFENKVRQIMRFIPKGRHYCLHLYVGSNNTAAIRYFCEVGFKTSQRLHKYFIVENGNRMRKELE